MLPAAAVTVAVVVLAVVIAVGLKSDRADEAMLVAVLVVVVAAVVPSWLDVVLAAKPKEKAVPAGTAVVDCCSGAGTAAVELIEKPERHAQIKARTQCTNPANTIRAMTKGGQMLHNIKYFLQSVMWWFNKTTKTF